MKTSDVLGALKKLKKPPTMVAFKCYWRGTLLTNTIMESKNSPDFITCPRKDTCQYKGKSKCDGIIEATPHFSGQDSALNYEIEQCIKCIELFCDEGEL